MAVTLDLKRPIQVVPLSAHLFLQPRHHLRNPSFPLGEATFPGVVAVHELPILLPCCLLQYLHLFHTY